MPQLIFEKCDQCGMQSKPHRDFAKNGWCYVGFYPKRQGPCDQRILCPKCSVKLKKWLSK
jgi:hypothetical protein